MLAFGPSIAHCFAPAQARNDKATFQSATKSRCSARGSRASPRLNPVCKSLWFLEHSLRTARGYTDFLSVSRRLSTCEYVVERFSQQNACALRTGRRDDCL